jgi:hypothetical protein
MLVTIQLHYRYFYSNERQKYLYLGLRNGKKKFQKNEMGQNIVDDYDI